MAKGFREKLAERQILANTLLCVGLDPVIDYMPDIVRRSSPSTAAGLLVWFTEIVDATAEAACMFKPQHAHWEAIDGGLEALKMLIAHIHYKYPDIPVFLDCKRGDIDRTQAQYGHAHFELEGVDGMNYNGYMGRDTIEKLIDPDHPERALVGLGRTSNQSAWEIQDALMADGRALWEHVATSQLGWARDLCVLENAGLVMGAAHLKPLPEGKIDQDPRDPENINSAHLVRAREITGKDMWYLIPGIGTQGGFVEQTVRVTYTGPGSIAINNSSGINFASSGPDFAEAAGEKACKTRDLMNAAQAA